MQDFINDIGPFSWGFAAGFLWYPIWKILKKIYSEAKQASKEWRNPSGKAD